MKVRLFTPRCLAPPVAPPSAPSRPVIPERVPSTPAPSHPIGQPAPEPIQRPGGFPGSGEPIPSVCPIDAPE